MVTEINVDFGNRVRSQREYCGLSQVRLGNKIGVSQGYVSKMETHGWVPSKEIVDKLTKVLDTNVNYLFNKVPVKVKKEEKEEKTDTEVIEKSANGEYLFNKVPVEIKKEEKEEKTDLEVKIPDDPDCDKLLALVQKNLDHLFKVTGDQFFVSPKTSLYSISEICKHYKISPSYLFEDHEKEWLKEEIEQKYKEIEEMEAELAALDKSLKDE